MSDNLTNAAAGGKVDKKDLKRLFFRSNMIQACFNFERMQGLGFLWAFLPLLNKLYKKKEDRVEAYKRHSGYFNTHPWLSGVIFGIVASFEERKSRGDEIEEESINSVKAALMGPLAGIGDALFFGAFRPIIAGVLASIILTAYDSTGTVGAGYLFVPLLFILIINFVHFGAQWWGVHSGYKMSENFLEKLEGMEIKRWMEAATILGLLVVGALAATWLNVVTPIQYVIGEGDAVVTVAIQGIFDRIMPRMLPLFVTLGVFGLLRKRISPTIVMIGIVVVSFLLGLFNILT